MINVVFTCAIPCWCSGRLETSSKTSRHAVLWWEMLQVPDSRWLSTLMLVAHIWKHANDPIGTTSTASRIARAASVPKDLSNSLIREVYFFSELEHLQFQLLWVYVCGETSSVMLSFLINELSISHCFNCYSSCQNRQELSCWVLRPSQLGGSLPDQNRELEACVENNYSEAEAPHQLKQFE